MSQQDYGFMPREGYRLAVDPSLEGTKKLQTDLFGQALLPEFVLRKCLHFITEETSLVYQIASGLTALITGLWVFTRACYNRF